MVYILLILAVWLSYLFVVSFKIKNQYVLRLLLAFSGSFLLALTVFELLPSVYRTTDHKTIGIFILLGILLQVFLEFYSQGLEHGHSPHSSGKSGTRILIFISLCIHALLEGIPIQSYEPIVVGILIHKIPVTVVLSIFLINLNLKKYQSFGIIVLFSLMTPLGSYLAQNFSLIQQYQAPLLALVIGVFLHISTVILFESSKGHQVNARKLFVIILGIVMAYLV
ncbi:MAG: ZIP family metal transporter [Flavobacteriaceae bacterium]